MMGKTNAVYAETSETSELSLISETIITDSADDIWKIEHINNMFFVFLDSGNVMFGEDITELKFLKKDGDYFHASYAIHKDGKYMFMCTETITDKMYVSTDLNDFDAVEMAEKVKDEYGIGLFLNSRGEIVVLTGKNQSKTVWHIGSFQSNNEMSDNSRFVDIQSIDYIKIYDYRKTRMFNNRYMVNAGESNGGTYDYYVVSTEGSAQLSAFRLSSFTSGYRASQSYIIGQEIYIIKQSQSNIKIYHSLNGVQSTLVAELNNEYYVDYITQCEDGIGVFSKKYPGDASDTFTFSERKENLADSFPGAIASEIPYNIIQCDYVAGEYTYLGCKGGIIYKIFVDFSGSSNSPQVSALKTLSAKQALAESKSYTDKKFAELEAKIAALDPSANEMEELKIYIDDDGNLCHTDGFVISKKEETQNG